MTVLEGILLGATLLGDTAELIITLVETMTIELMELVGVTTDTGSGTDDIAFIVRVESVAGIENVGTIDKLEISIGGKLETGPGAIVETGDMAEGLDSGVTGDNVG